MCADDCSKRGNSTPFGEFHFFQLTDQQAKLGFTADDNGNEIVQEAPTPKKKKVDTKRGKLSSRVASGRTPKSAKRKGINYQPTFKLR